jgi:hypothetical protein
VVKKRPRRASVCAEIEGSVGRQIGVVGHQSESTADASTSGMIGRWSWACAERRWDDRMQSEVLTDGKQLKRDKIEEDTTGG